MLRNNGSVHNGGSGRIELAYGYMREIRDLSERSGRRGSGAQARAVRRKRTAKEKTALARAEIRQTTQRPHAYNSAGRGGGGTRACRYGLYPVRTVRTTAYNGHSGYERITFRLTGAQCAAFAGRAWHHERDQVQGASGGQGAHHRRARARPRRRRSFARGRRRAGRLRSYRSAFSQRRREHADGRKHTRIQIGGRHGVLGLPHNNGKRVRGGGRHYRKS